MVVQGASVAGHSRFDDCVKILLNGENDAPDFNAFDYAIGFRTHDMTLVGWLNSMGFTTCEMPGLYPLWVVRSLFALVVVSPVLVWLMSLMGRGLLAGLFALVLIGLIVHDLEVSAYTRQLDGKRDRH